MSWRLALKCADRLELDNRLPSEDVYDYHEFVASLDDVDEGVSEAWRSWLILTPEHPEAAEASRRFACELRRWARTADAAEATIAEYQDAAHTNARAKGWWEKETVGGHVVVTSADRVLALLMLVTTEVAEAAEDVRTGHMLTTFEPSGKPVGFPSELADIVIRCLDLAGAMGIDLQHEIALKMQHNATRPARHGGKLA